MDVNAIEQVFLLVLSVHSINCFLPSTIMAFPIIDPIFLTPH